MSLLEQLQQFRGSPKLIINQKYIDDKGAKQIAKFIDEHGRVQYLQLKSNDISGIGFAEIFKSLQKNPNIRQIIIQHNRLGQEGIDSWPIYFSQLISKSPKIQRLNFSNNKIGARAFSEMRTEISKSKSLKLLQLRYNQIPASEIVSFVDQLKSFKNEALLYVELAGNKLDRDLILKIQDLLKQNRQKNPIPKDNLLMTGGSFNLKPSDQRSFQSQSKFSRNNAVDDLSKENVLRHLETLLDQARRGTIQLKNRFEQQLSELQQKQKADANQILDLDRKCNELAISNRNINYELERTQQQHRQIQMDLEYQARVKEERIHEANRQLTEMQLKYEQIQNKMNMEHQAKLKQIGRVWQLRLRNVEQRIRNIEADENSVDLQIQKTSQKRQKLRADYQQEQRILRNRIQQQQSQRYRLKLQVLEAKIKQVESSRDNFYKRGDDIVYQLESNTNQTNQEIQNFQTDMQQLKAKQKQLVDKNRDYMSRNEMIKQDITIKQVAIEKLQEQINRINQQIQHKKVHNRQQIDKIIEDHEADRLKKGGEKRNQIQKLGQLESTYRKYQLENAKLEQEYRILQQKLQIAISKGVQQVFAENHLY